MCPQLTDEMTEAELSYFTQSHITICTIVSTSKGGKNLSCTLWKVIHLTENELFGCDLWIFSTSQEGPNPMKYLKKSTPTVN